MAPHIARMMGFRRTLPHIVISALTGGVILALLTGGKDGAVPVSDPGGPAVDL